MPSEIHRQSEVLFFLLLIALPCFQNPWILASSRASKLSFRTHVTWPMDTWYSRGEDPAFGVVVVSGCSHNTVPRWRVHVCLAKCVFFKMLGSFQLYLLWNCWKYFERDLEYAAEPSIGERREVLHFLRLYDKSGEQCYGDDVVVFRTGVQHWRYDKEHGTYTASKVRSRHQVNGTFGGKNFRAKCANRDRRGGF